MNPVLLSVIVPVYNCAPFLVSSLESLKKSGADSAEFIIVDDGSTDTSPDICRRFGREDTRFKIYTKKRGGPSSARNFALSHATGEYVTFLDADDAVKDGAYARLTEIIKKNSYPDLVVFGADLLPRGAPDYMKELVSPRNKVYRKFTPEMLFSEVGARPFLWMQAIKRSIIEENGLRMDEDISLGEDQLFQMSYIPYTNHTVFTEEKLYSYRWLSPGSIMNRTSEDLKRKLLLHSELIDRIFSLFESRGYGYDMMSRLLDFSISFVYHDLTELTSLSENECAIKFLDVLDKHGADRYKNGISIWAMARYDHIRIMGIKNQDKRIEILRRECGRARNDISRMEKDGYKLKKERVGIFSLASKLMKSLKNDGIRVTLNKIRRRLKV